MYTLNSIPHYTAHFFKEAVLDSISIQQKKIILIASLAFSLLAAYYLIKHYCFTVKSPEVRLDDAVDNEVEIEHPADKVKLQQTEPEYVEDEDSEVQLDNANEKNTEFSGLIEKMKKEIIDLQAQLSAANFKANRFLD